MASTAPAVDFRPVSAEGSAALRTLAFVLIGLGLFRLVVNTVGADHRNDFAHYYLSANILLDGENPYVTPLEPLCRAAGLEYDGRIPVGANPPLLIRAMTVLAWLPLPVAYAIWAAVQVATLGVLLAAVGRLLRLDGRDVRWLLLAGVMLNATCLQRQFYYSQMQIVVAACVAGALVLHSENRRMASCALVALAAALKLYPAVLIPWFLLAGLRGWRDFLGRSVAVASIAGAVLAVTGVDAWRSFVVDGLPVINRSVGGSLTNYSLPAMASIFAGEVWGQPLPADVAPFAAVVGKCLAGVAVIGAYLVVWRRRLENVAAVGVLTAAMIAASPVCWSHYFVLMILPVAWLWLRAMPTSSRPARLIPLIAGALCLWPELDWLAPLGGGLPRMALHFYPLAALGCVAVQLATSRAQGSPRFEKPAREEPPV